MSDDDVAFTRLVIAAWIDRGEPTDIRGVPSEVADAMEMARLVIDRECLCVDGACLLATVRAQRAAKAKADNG